MYGSRLKYGWLIVLCCLGCESSPPPTPVLTAKMTSLTLSPTEKQIMQLITAYHYDSPSSQWLKLGPEGGEAVLAFMPKLSDVLAYQVRLVDGLRYFPSDTVKQQLRQWAKDPNQKLRLREQAITSLVDVEQTNRIQLMNFLKELLNHSEAPLRAHILEQLLRIKSPLARGLVIEALKTETSSLVKARLHRKMIAQFNQRD